MMEEKSIQKILLGLIQAPQKVKISPNQWPELIEKAQEEGLVGLLFYNLKHNNALDILSKKAKEQLEKLYFNQLGQNMLLIEQGKRALQTFKEKNIEVILLKGIHLQFLYPENCTRPMIDIDFFIKKEDFNKAELVLKTLGFNNAPPLYKEDFFKDKLMIDLHCELINTARVNVRSTIASQANKLFFQEAIGFQLDDQKVKILNIYDEIIYLCAHLFFHHGLHRLIWFFDIKLLIENYPDFDWNRLFERALSFGLEKPLFVCILLVKTKLGLDVPDEFLKKEEQVKISKIEKRIYNKLSSSGKKETAFRYLFTFFVLKGIRRKIVLLKELVFPSSEILEELYASKEKGTTLDYYCQHVKKITKLILKSLKALLFHAKD